jgi:hypothetical protein
MKKIAARIIFMALLPIVTVLKLTMQPSGTEGEAGHDGWCPAMRCA